MKYLVLGLALGFILGAAATALAGVWLDSREVGEDRDAGDRYALTLAGLSDKRRDHACVVAAEAFYGHRLFKPHETKRVDHKNAETDVPRDEQAFYVECAGRSFGDLSPRGSGDARD